VEDFDSIEFKAIDRGLGFHRASLVVTPVSDTDSIDAGPVTSRLPSAVLLRHAWLRAGRDPAGGGCPPTGATRARPIENSEADIARASRNLTLPSLFLDQFFILCIFSLLCFVPLFQFQLLKHFELANFSARHLPLANGLLLLLCVIEAFYYLFFKQFKLPLPGKWIIERKSKPKGR